MVVISFRAIKEFGPSIQYICHIFLMLTSEDQNFMFTIFIFVLRCIALKNLKGVGGIIRRVLGKGRLSV